MGMTVSVKQTTGIVPGGQQKDRKLPTIDWKMRERSDGRPGEGAGVDLGLESEAARRFVSGFTGGLVPAHPIPFGCAEKARPNDRIGLNAFIISLTVAIVAIRPPRGGDTD
jgi:hypothetical protein